MTPHPVAWTEEKVASFWDYISGTGEWFSEKHSSDLTSRVLRLRPRRFLDVGCGTGPLVAELARRGVTSTGIDSSPEVLAQAMARVPTARFIEGSAIAIPLPDGSQDVVTLVEVVEHLDDAALDATIREARRVLVPGGHLVITTPNAENLREWMRRCPDCGAEFHIYQHVRSWTADTLRGYLEGHGFRGSVRPVRLVENGPPLMRLTRRLVYALRGDRPRLLAVVVRT